MSLFKAQYFQCIEKLDKELVPNYRRQFEALYKAEAPTWETHGSLMVLGGIPTGRGLGIAAV